MKDIETRLRLMYYDASDGPRLMIFGPLSGEYQALQDVFVRLSKSPGERCELHEQSFIAAHGGVRLTLVCSGPEFTRSRQLSCSGLRRIGGSDSPVFEWGRTTEGWDYLAELIAPVVQESVPGHQYLTAYPGQDAIVVLSRGEYGDEILE